MLRYIQKQTGWAESAQVQHGTLLTALGLPPIPPTALVQWSPGVDARLGWPSLVARTDRS